MRKDGLDDVKYLSELNMSVSIGSAPLSIGLTDLGKDQNTSALRLVFLQKVQHDGDFPGVQEA